MDANVVQRLAATAFEAVLDDRRWATLLTQLSAALEAPGGMLFTPEPRPGRAMVFAPASCEAEIRANAARAVPNPWVQRLAELRHPRAAGQCVVGSQFLSPAELARSGYHERLQANFQVGPLVSLFVEGDDAPVFPRTHLMICREVGDADFDDADVRTLRALHAPLQLALRAYWALSHVRRLERAAESAYDALPEPVFVLRADGGIVFVNRAAETVLRERTLVAALHGCLIADGLQAAIARTLLGAPQRLSVSVARDARLVHGELQLARLPADMAFDERWPQAAVVATLHLDRSDGGQSRLEAFARHHGLTAAETQVLDALAWGLAPAQVAQRRGVKLSSVRTHIRGLLEKTGCHRQAELLRLFRH
jgi:DNA-binding CsgD family transcriptional regulator